MNVSLRCFKSIKCDDQSQQNPNLSHGRTKVKHEGKWTPLTREPRVGLGCHSIGNPLPPVEHGAAGAPVLPFPSAPTPSTGEIPVGQTSFVRVNTHSKLCRIVCWGGLVPISEDRQEKIMPFTMHDPLIECYHSTMATKSKTVFLGGKSSIEKRGNHKPNHVGRRTK